MTKPQSPNFDARPNGQSIDTLILHYTGMRSGAEAFKRMCAENSKVSAHYMVEEDGRVFSLVEEGNRAWHAGVSSWAGASDMNSRSIGVEIVNPGHEFGYRPFPRPQIDAVIKLCEAIVNRHLITTDRVLGHSDVAPARKEDPGELFPWALLAAAGVGEYVDPHSVGPGLDLQIGPGDSGDPVRALQKRFRAFGYGVEITTQYDLLTEHVVRAFQRHFRPEEINGVADAHTHAVLKTYLARRNIAL